jgi:hypothetical protein
VTVPGYIDDLEGIEQFFLRQNINGFSCNLLQDCCK